MSAKRPLLALLSSLRLSEEQRQRDIVGNRDLPTVIVHAIALLLFDGNFDGNKEIDKGVWSDESGMSVFR